MAEYSASRKNCLLLIQASMKFHDKTLEYLNCYLQNSKFYYLLNVLHHYFLAMVEYNVYTSLCWAMVILIFKPGTR